MNSGNEKGCLEKSGCLDCELSRTKSPFPAGDWQSSCVLTGLDPAGSPQELQLLTGQPDSLTTAVHNKYPDADLLCHSLLS